MYVRRSYLLVSAHRTFDPILFIGNYRQTTSTKIMKSMPGPVLSGSNEATPPPPSYQPDLSNDPPDCEKGDQDIDDKRPTAAKDTVHDEHRRTLSSKAKTIAEESEEDQFDLLPLRSLFALLWPVLAVTGFVLIINQDIDHCSQYRIFASAMLAYCVGRMMEFVAKGEAARLRTCDPTTPRFVPHVVCFMEFAVPPLCAILAASLSLILLVRGCS